MEYAAIGLTILGLSAGLMSRLKVFLLLVGGVLLFSIGFSLQGGFSVLATVAVVVGAQAILQSSYLLGVAIHTVLSPSQVAECERESEAMDSAGQFLANRVLADQIVADQILADRVSADAVGRPGKSRRWPRRFAQETVRSELSSRQR